MPATPATMAAQAANTLISVAQQYVQLQQTVAQLATYMTDNGIQTTLNAMATSAFLADGSIGAADGTPNTNHPINASYGLNRAITAFQISQLVSVCTAIANATNGQAVTANAGAMAILLAATGG